MAFVLFVPSWLSRLLALQEAIKELPWGAVWDFYCATGGVAVGRQWLDEMREYESGVMLARI